MSSLSDDAHMKAVIRTLCGGFVNVALQAQFQGHERTIFIILFPQKLVWALNDNNVLLKIKLILRTVETSPLRLCGSFIYLWLQSGTAQGSQEVLRCSCSASHNKEWTCSSLPHFLSRSSCPRGGGSY